MPPLALETAPQGRALSPPAKLGEVVSLFGNTVRTLAEGETMTLAEAAEFLQTTPQDVHFIVKSGLLSSFGMGDKQRVRVCDLVSLRLRDALRPACTLDSVFDAARAEGVY